MWQVITTSPAQWSAAHWQAAREFPVSEIDGLLEALGKFTPQKKSATKFPVNTRKTLQPSPAQSRRAQPVTVTVAARPVTVTPELPAAPRTPREILDSVALPRTAQNAPPLLLSAAMRAQLNELRSTILVAAQTKNLRSVLLCGAGVNDSAHQLMINLSQLLAEIERLKIAVIAVTPAPVNASAHGQREYNLQLRRTRQNNLFEIVSTHGAVQINDWLQNWEPKAALHEMQKMFDLILISTPAITACPDVALFAQAADAVVLVATENVTPYASIEAAQQRLQAAHAKILGAVMHRQAAPQSKLAIVKSQVREFMDSFSGKKK